MVIVFLHFLPYKIICPPQFGRPLPLCSIGEGFIPKAAERAVGILAMSHIQTKVVPALHPVGFQKVKIPKDIYAR